MAFGRQKFKKSRALPVVRFLLMILFMLFMINMLAGCSMDDGGQEEPAVEDTEAKAENFIFVCPIIENEYWEDCVQGIRKADEELGTSTKVIGPRTADNFTEEIVGYMEEAVAEKPDGILAYAGIDALAPLIDGAAAEGIPVLSVDSDAPDTARIAYVGTDLYNFGYHSGETLVDLVEGKAEVGYICSKFSAKSEKTVYHAFLDAVHDYGIQVVAEAEGHADPDYAEGVAEQMLMEHPELDAIFCTAGYNATGAARAKEHLGREDLVLVGFDDVEENLDFVRKGVIDALMVQSPEQMGYRGGMPVK